MTISDILKAQGVSDEIINAVLEEMKTNKIFTASEENLDVRYSKLKGQHTAATEELTKAQARIAEFEKAAQGGEETQKQLSDAQAQVQQLQKELNDAKVEAAMDRKLMASGAKADDVDYLKFQWRKNGDVALDEKGEIKNGDDAITSLKTQRPASFETEKKRTYLENPLPEKDGGDRETNPESLEDALKEHFEQKNE